MSSQDAEVLYIMSDASGRDSAAIARLRDGRTRFVIYGLDGCSCYVDMTDEVVRQVQAALSLAIGSVN
jgi:hypothetical protein